MHPCIRGFLIFLGNRSLDRSEIFRDILDEIFKGIPRLVFSEIAVCQNSRYCWKMGKSQFFAFTGKHHDFEFLYFKLATIRNKIIIIIIPKHT